MRIWCYLHNQPCILYLGAKHIQRVVFVLERGHSSLVDCSLFATTYFYCLSRKASQTPYTIPSHYRHCQFSNLHYSTPNATRNRQPPRSLDNIAEWPDNLFQPCQPLLPISETLFAIFQHCQAPQRPTSPSLTFQPRRVIHGRLPSQPSLRLHLLMRGAHEAKC